jgi:circadian clock protein KaiC
MAVQRVKTGLGKLDVMLGGGLPKGSITTVSGPTGSGKSVLGIQFLISGIKTAGEPGLYIAIEESKSTLYRNMASLGWDIKQYESSNQLVVIDFPFHEVDQLIDNRNPLKELIDRFGVERVVIDSIMPVAAKFQTDGERNKAFMKMIENARAWDTTTLIMTNDVKATTDQIMPQTEFGAERFTDGWIHLYYLFKANQRKRMLEIVKMKGSEHETGMVPFTIGKNGISL